MSALEIQGVEVDRGETRVLHGVELHVEPGEIVSLLGRNGVGKSTLLGGVVGLNPVRSGQVRIANVRADVLPPYAIARLGVGYAPQEGGIFAELTVEENLLLALGSRARGRQAAEALEALFPQLVSHLHQRAGTLSGGEQKMLLTARAFAGERRLVLLDEVTEGVQPAVRSAIAEAIQAASGQETAVLLVEQNVSFALEVASRYYVMEKGRIARHGATGDADADGKIREHLVI